MGLASDIKQIFRLTKSTQAWVQNEMFVFPEGTNETCTLTAGAVNNTFGNWAVIANNLGVTLDSKFIAGPTTVGSVFLDQCDVHSFSVDANVYILEIGYGAPQTVVCRARWLSTAAAIRPMAYQILLHSRHIPVGEALYYRMKCQTGLATCRTGFRYYFLQR